MLKTIIVGIALACSTLIAQSATYQFAKPVVGLISSAQSGGGGAPSVPSDPNWANVALLLKMDQTAGLVDLKGHAINSAPGVAFSAVDPKFGESSLSFSGGHLGFSPTPDFEVGAGDFTIETFVKFNDPYSYQTIFSFTPDFHLGVFMMGGHLRYFASHNGTDWTSAISGDSGPQNGVGALSVSAGVWHHVAMVRQGNQWFGFLDGQLDWQLSTAGWSVVNRPTDSFRIGVWGQNGYTLNGQVDEFRFTKGVARYTASFTPPTAAFPAQ